MASNLRSVFLGTKLAYPLLTAAGGGAIVNVSSVHAVATSPNISSYAASKGGLLALTRAMAIEFAGDNIRVNTINPGLVLTPDWVKTAKQIAGDNYEAHLQGVADEAGGMKRFATPEELAHFFVFLCSNKASYSTGSTYFVDGGWLRTV